MSSFVGAAMSRGVFAPVSTRTASQPSPLAGVRAVIFDMDGTLIDSEPVTEKTIQRVLNEAGLSWSHLDFTQFHGATWDKISADLISHFPSLKSSDLRARLIAEFDGVFTGEEPTFIPGAAEFIAKASRDYPLVIVTSAHQDAVEHMLASSGFAHHISFYLCDRDVVRSKPDPEGYLKAAARLGLQPYDCMVFEDSTNGLKSAQAAGMRTARIGTLAEVRADYDLADFRGALGWLV